MPRTPSVRYFESRKAYYTQYRGTQHCLACGPKDEPDGLTFQAAVKKFAEIMHVAEADRAEDDNLVITVLDRYAVHLRDHKRMRSYRMVKDYLQGGIEEFGGLKIKEFKNMHVQAWLDKMGQDRGEHRGRVKRWGETMKRLAAEKLITALNWAAGQGMITRNPIDKKALGLKRKVSRGRDHVLQPGEHEKMVAAAKPFFGDLLNFLEGTGCRPGEAYNLQAFNYCPGDGVIVYRWDAQEGYVHKTAQRTGKDRIIYLTPDLVEVIERLRGRHPTGLLFRNRDGRKWTDSAVLNTLKNIRERLGLRKRMIPYSYRHTFATRWLLAGGSIKVLADLLGTSIAMIEKHYGHLEVDKATMRQMLCNFRQRLPAQPAAG